ncbi:HRDC domain-containing protein [Flavobacterium paronense]|uniref:HRDC domain-containing protein n=1 Tax=Flavobacterium paronense TaxID=1392775 RepID=A0ABV5GEE7_9FLAO|nr:HRDC domain-containing protein [Flavobacterium paronense]MDN3678327.1 HRDC domain-containing protein [Flavobacterium paronense]
MNIKIFNIRLNKEHCQNDQIKMNEFLDTVEVKLTSTNFVTTGTLDFWSAVVFFEPKTIKRETSESKFSETDLLPDELKAYKALKSWRNDLAEKLDWSAFRICHNSHLIAIVKSNPQTLDDLEHVYGFGKARVEKYGDDIMSVLNAL